MVNKYLDWIQIPTKDYQMYINNSIRDNIAVLGNLIYNRLYLCKGY